MTIDTKRAAIDGVDGYPSLAALREAHGAILEQRRLRGETPDLFAAAEQFIRRGIATGALLDDSEERRAAQNLLNYWANALYRAGREPVDATLADFDPLLAPELPDALCPYLGLDAFSETSANRFFGRQELIARLLDRLRDQRFLAVVGPSGSGKSSVIRAGLLPALQGGALPASESWQYVPPLVPGSDPIESLARALRLLTTAGQPRTDSVPTAATPASTASAEGRAPLDSEALLHNLLLPTGVWPAQRGQPQGNGGSAAPAVAPAQQTYGASLVPDTLRLRQDVGALAQRLAAAGASAVLVVDQFEEIFTLCEDPPTRQAFVDNLLALASTPGMHHRVILTM